MSLRQCSNQRQAILIENFHPKAEILIGKVEFVDGRTFHVPGRLISGAIYHISYGFKAGGKNPGNSKQTGNKQNLGRPIQRLHEKARLYEYDVRPSASRWVFLMCLLDSGPGTRCSDSSLLMVEEASCFLIFPWIDTKAVLHLVSDCLRLFFNVCSKAWVERGTAAEFDIEAELRC